MPNNISKLIAEARLKEALEALKNHPKYETDSQFQHQVIGTFSRLAQSQQQEMMGLIPPDDATREKNRIAQAILAIADRYGIKDGGSSNKPTLSPTPTIPETNQNEGAPLILFLASDPRDVGKLNLDKEFVSISRELGDKATGFNLKVMPDQRRDTLLRTLLDEQPTYIHFAGHGDKGQEGFNPAGIVLQDRDRNPQVVSGSALASMFEMLKDEFEIKVVLLNVCDSMDHARLISANGIHAIGMAEEIPDNMAIIFAGGFYLGLARSPDNIPKAFKYALLTLELNDIKSDNIPRLFFNEEQVND